MSGETGHARVVNPEAVGDPGRTPVVETSGFLGALIAQNPSSGETVTARPVGRRVQKLARNLHDGWWVLLDGAWLMVEAVTLTARGARVTFADGAARDLPLGGDYEVVIP